MSNMVRSGQSLDIRRAQASLNEGRGTRDQGPGTRAKSQMMSLLALFEQLSNGAIELRRENLT